MAQKNAGSRTADAVDNQLAGPIKQIKRIKQIDRIIQIVERNSRGGKWL